MVLVLVLSLDTCGLGLDLGLVSFGLGLGFGLEPCGLVNITDRKLIYEHYLRRYYDFARESYL